jgi:hypothetical protein
MKLNWLPYCTASLLAVAATGANALAIHDASLYTTNTLAANDDGSTGEVNLGFTALINGTSYTQTFVNNNGNITFTQPLSTYTPSGITDSSFPIIAPFWADVDTRGSGSGLTQYGTATVDGHATFGVNWINVGYFAAHTDKLNSFQLILTDRSDTGAGNFDIQYNYDKVIWETGDASSGHNGLGGTPVAVGYTVGTGQAFQLPGSLVSGALLDGGPDALTGHSLDSTVLGQYNFQVRGGQIITPQQPPQVTAVPEPETYALMLLGLGAIALGVRRRRQRD